MCHLGTQSMADGLHHGMYIVFIFFDGVIISIPVLRLRPTLSSDIYPKFDALCCC